jgi:hypothetical protein
MKDQETNHLYIIDFDSLLKDHRKVCNQKGDIGLYFDFFKNFFRKYSYESSQFIFVVQTGKYTDLLCKFVLEKFTDYDIRFILVENHSNLFVCHYFYHFFQYYETGNTVYEIISNTNVSVPFEPDYVDKKLTISVLKTTDNQFHRINKSLVINKVVFSKQEKRTPIYSPFYLTSII